VAGPNPQANSFSNLNRQTRETPVKSILHMLPLMLSALSVQAASIHGNITLPYSTMDTNKTIQTRQVGDAVKATWKCRIGEFYGWETVFAQVTITNTVSRPVWGQCSVAFYD
jgi:hypothetical protein